MDGQSRATCSSRIARSEGNNVERRHMQTTIEIDEKLMAKVLQITGLKSRDAAIDLALRTRINPRKQESIRAYRSRLRWGN